MFAKQIAELEQNKRAMRHFTILLDNVQDKDKESYISLLNALLNNEFVTSLTVKGLSTAWQAELLGKLLKKICTLRSIIFIESQFNDQLFEIISSALLENHGIEIVSFSNEDPASCASSSSSNGKKIVEITNSSRHIIKLIQKGCFSKLYFSSQTLDVISDLSELIDVILNSPKIENIFLGRSGHDLNRQMKLKRIERNDPAVTDVKFDDRSGSSLSLDYTNKIIEALKNNTRVTTLHVDFGLNLQTAKPLAELLARNRTIKSLIFAGQLITDETFSCLGDSIFLSSVEQIRIIEGKEKLESTEEGFLHIREIEECLQFKILTASAEEAREFQVLEHWRTRSIFPYVLIYVTKRLEIEKIICNGAPLTDHEFRQLLNALKEHQNLLFLDFSNSQLSNSVMSDLIAFLKKHSITDLNLGHNHFTDEAVVILAEFLKTDSKMTRLVLSENPVKSHGLVALGHALTVNKTLIELDLSESEKYNPLAYGKQIETSELNNFATSISGNGSLISIHLPWPKVYIYSTSSNYTATRNFQIPAKFKKFLETHKLNKDNAILAVIRGDLAGLQNCLRLNVSPYCTDEHGNTLLHIAVKHKHAHIVKFLLTVVQVNRKIRNNAGLTAKQMSQEIAEKEKNTKLLDCFDLVLVPPKPIAKQGMLTFAKRNVDLTPSPAVDQDADQPMAVDGESVPVPADDSIAKKSRPDVSEMLVAEFYFAALNGQTETVRKMLDNVPINSTLSNGETALHAAARMGHIAVVRLLLLNDALVNAGDCLNQTALHMACDLNNPINTLAVVKELLSSAKICVNAVDKLGRTPLFCIAGNLNTVPSHKVDEKQKAEIAWQLIMHGANPHASLYDLELGIQNMTPLHKAVFRQQYKICNALLSSAATTYNAQNGMGDTALHLATKNCNTDIVTLLLLQPDINLSIKNNQHETALDIVNNLLTLNPENKNAVEVKQLLEERAKKIVLSRVPQVHFATSLTLFYSHRHKPTLKIEGQKDHATLRSGLKPDNPGNDLTASLTFIVGQKDGSRYTITVDLQGASFHPSMAWKGRTRIGEGEKSRTRSRDALLRITDRWQQSPSEAQQRCVDHYAPGKPLSAEAIQSLFNNPSAEPAFEQVYHHSEVGLCDFMESPENIAHIVDKLIGSHGFQSGSKVYPVLVLRMHSRYYLCANCEMNILGEQNPATSKFLKGMAAELERRGSRLSKHHSLRLAVCISAEKPATGMSFRNAEHHHDIFVDLRAYYSHVILENTIAPNLGMMNFVSRMK